MEDVKRNVEADLRQLVATILEVEPEAINDQASFVKDLGMDSMMALEILASIEKKYKIVIPEETLAKFTSLSQTVNIVQNMLEKR
jgi:acyl carrier protein